MVADHGLGGAGAVGAAIAWSVGKHGGWQAPFSDPAVGEFVTELNPTPARSRQAVACSPTASSRRRCVPANLSVTDLGVVIGTYEPTGPVRYGHI